MPAPKPQREPLRWTLRTSLVTATLLAMGLVAVIALRVLEVRGSS
jgi:hypothetical protein